MHNVIDNNINTRNAVLTELQDANRRFALDAKGTTNHCPMALVALANMGATPERLRAFFDMWDEKYAIPAPVSNVTIARDDWYANLRGDDFEALRDCFEAWIHEDGIDAVLLAVLSRIPFAPATGAFHALIRLGYGLESGHVAEMAAGLAYLMVGNADLAIPPSQSAATVEAGFVSISAAMAGSSFPGDMIVARVRSAVADPRFAPALCAVPISTGLLAEMAGLAIATYWQTRNFTVMHMVTGLYAARQIFAHLPEALVLHLLPQMWVSLCGAYASVGAPLIHASQLEDDTLPSEGDWAGLFEKAVLSDNDHVIKMTYTCYRESQVYPSPVYFACVKRML
jgi:Questin oxidase-like